LIGRACTIAARENALFVIPETGWTKNVAFKFINSEFKVVNIFDSYIFYKDFLGRIITQESYHEYFFKCYYLNIAENKFEKELLIHIENPYNRITGEEFATQNELDNFYDNLYNDWVEIAPISNENIKRRSQGDGSNVLSKEN